LNLNIKINEIAINKKKIQKGSKKQHVLNPKLKFKGLPNSFLVSE